MLSFRLWVLAFWLRLHTLLAFITYTSLRTFLVFIIYTLLHTFLNTCKYYTEIVT